MKKAKTMTDLLQEQTQQIGKLNEQVNTLTSQRDALLEVCRAFVSDKAPWHRNFQFMLLERLVDEMKGVEIVIDSET